LTILSIENESGCQRSKFVITHLTDLFQRRKTFDWYNTWKEKSINYSICSSSYQQKYIKKQIFQQINDNYSISVPYGYIADFTTDKKQLQKYSIIAMRTSASTVITFLE